jgi:ATP-dependent DNA helicase RecG
MTTIDELNQLIKDQEGCRLEFKSARASYSEKDLSEYCAAISNEGGGKFLLGVNNDGEVVGTSAFIGTHNQLQNKLLQGLGIRVDVEEIKHSDGRVLIFNIPAHLPGKPIRLSGKYLMRAGESLVEMDEGTLKRILNEAEPDYSSKIVNGLTVSDLDSEALENFKKRWAEKSKREEYLTCPNTKMLQAINIITDQGVKYAGLILFGKKEKIDEYLPGSEIIYEWRQDEGKTSFDTRKTWREPLFKVYDEIWETINARNIRMPFQEGFIQREILAFSEKPVREAVLNAVAHRDYTDNSRSVIIKASPESFYIESPGGFPHGVTPENVLTKIVWRNRQIAETLEKAGLVERSGQGMDDIFTTTIKEGKGLPDLSKSDAHSVRLIIPALVKDEKFILFIEKIIKEKQVHFSSEEIYELERIREKQVVESTKYRQKFITLGIIEQVGKARGAKYILSHKYYQHEGKVGVYTRITGLSREKEKELILKHLEKNKRGYRKELEDAFSELSPMDISNLLQELRREEKIEFIGPSKNGYWRLK